MNNTADQTSQFQSTEKGLPRAISTVQECPSNIALVKYWGKYPVQLPANPSISYTLTQCRTISELSFTPNDTFDVKVFLAGKAEEKFASKIKNYFEKIQQYLPWVCDGSYTLKTENTFPHSSGIASSASGFGALARCLMSMNRAFGIEMSPEEELRKASFLARIGSGSACRSLYNGLVVWGKTDALAGSSDLYAAPYPDGEVAPVFRQMNDWVLLVHEGEKSVSSTVGHSLMENHPYAQRRFAEAQENMQALTTILKSGDLEAFIRLVEHEALTLHAMMMMSNPAFILMKSQTLKIIEKIWEYRRSTGDAVFFTLDAGANIHLMFPRGDVDFEQRVQSFVEAELLPLTQHGNVVKDFASF